jgi:hypothetical protein
VEGILPGTRAGRHMTTSQKALALYGPLAAGMLVCTALAALGSFKAIPVLDGPVKKVCMAGAAIAMAIQGAALFPTKWESRLIIKPHPLATGSLMFFAGAALLLVLVFGGCNLTAAKPHAGHTINFYGTESTGYWSMFGADVPGSFAAQEMPWKTQRIKPGCQPADAILRACGSGIASVRDQSTLAGVRRAALTVALIRRHRMIGIRI